MHLFRINIQIKILIKIPIKCWLISKKINMKQATFNQIVYYYSKENNWRKCEVWPHMIIDRVNLACMAFRSKSTVLVDLLTPSGLDLYIFFAIVKTLTQHFDDWTSGSILSMLSTGRRAVPLIVDWSVILRRRQVFWAASYLTWTPVQMNSN